MAPLKSRQMYAYSTISLEDAREGLVIIAEIFFLSLKFKTNESFMKKQIRHVEGRWLLLYDDTKKFFG